jgi:hypothetical protein
MNWTNEKPTEPGWYWNKSIATTALSICLIFRCTFDENLRVSFIGHNNSKLLEKCESCFWAGPIEPPEFPTCAP